MASSFYGNRQSDWVLFNREYPSSGVHDQNDDYDNESAPTHNHVEVLEDHYEIQTLSAPPPHSIRDRTTEFLGGHGSLVSTPTQRSLFDSSYFSKEPYHPTSKTMTATTPARQSQSPSSSPRLPSPPPYTEVQFGPKSPSIVEADRGELGVGRKEEDGSSRRIRPGTKAADMASGPPLIPLSQLDSPFQLQEHLKALHHTYTKTADGTGISPITRDTAMILATPPEGIDKQLWLYELCRFLTMKANNLIIAFFAENPPCSAETCPEMRASEWQYLCAVHEPPKSCCAIDYCCHTLDWATNVLTSPKYFPSRLTLGSEAAGGAQTSMRYLINIFRRVYRIFAHAWFQHRGVFWQVEGHDGLYVFFKTVCDVYALIGEDNYTIPAEAEGHDIHIETPVSAGPPEISILKKGSADSTTNQQPSEHPSSLSVPETEPTISTGATARRHKHTPSTGTNVTTITEGEEDESSTSNEYQPKYLSTNHAEESLAAAVQRQQQQQQSEGLAGNATAVPAPATEPANEVSENVDSGPGPSVETEATQEETPPQEPGVASEKSAVEPQGGISEPEQPAAASEEEATTATTTKEDKQPEENAETVQEEGSNDPAATPANTEEPTDTKEGEAEDKKKENDEAETKDGSVEGAS